MLSLIASWGSKSARIGSRRVVSAASITLLILLAVSSACPTAVQALPSRTIRLASSRVGQCVPIFIGIENPLNLGGASLSATVSVSEAGGSIQLGCDRPDLVASPTGSWPLILNYPVGGPTSQSIKLPTSNVSASGFVHLYACPSGVDASNPQNWTATQTLLLVVPDVDSTSK
jgi:hypothetical protein